MATSKKKICRFLLFFFDKGENASQTAENENNIYGPNTVTANHGQSRFHQFRSGNFNIKEKNHALKGQLSFD